LAGEDHPAVAGAAVLAVAGAAVAAEEANKPIQSHVNVLCNNMGLFFLTD